ncbi:class II aldolase/adducin family protein [Selenomonadales bacterium OttesenSCG-928-I06]|nr:class II aldolase/adducin family protein [Selenomonadales bacterium OttesenSCG-928-I06]
MKIIQIKEKIINTALELQKKGLVAGTWGNISAKIDDDIIAITPSGMDYNKLKTEDIVIVDSQGNVQESNREGVKPSSELLLHLAIYDKRPDLQAIVHTHSTYASVFAVARKEIPPIIEDLVQIVGGSVEVADYALPGSSTLALNAALSLQDKMAVILASHGLVGGGRVLEEALLVCEIVEKAAKICLFGNLLGGCAVLDEEDVSVMHDFYLKHYSKPLLEED